MTIKELKIFLNLFDNDKEVFVFDEDESTFNGVESICNNNGHLQINAERWGEFE